MTKHPRRKSDAARRANQIIRSRTVLLMALFGVVTFVMLFIKHELSRPAQAEETVAWAKQHVQAAQEPATETENG